MSSDPAKPRKLIPIAVIGAGCAGLSLAAKADLLPGYALALVAPRPERPQPDHIWGMWQMDWLKDTVPLARKTWHKWAIRSAETEVVMQSATYPYHALTRQTWLAHCRQRAAHNGVTFHDEMSELADLPAQQVFDSRPPKQRSDMMLQHFIGWQVRAASGSFDDDKAILMDFRCDQSRGMHFIYCLPFSDSEALVESTLFSPSLEPDRFYEMAISKWLTDCAGLTEFEVTQTEIGAIPLGLMARHDSNLQGIGGNGGAIRPSSGYAFSFIQKQIAKSVAQVADGDQLRFTRPHKTIDLWMDRVFLSVMRHQPQHAPEIFTKMAARLTGDEFALFLSGEADMKLRAKVVTAMPPLPFLQAALRPEAGAP